MTTNNIPSNYLPKQLSKHDRTMVATDLARSKKFYKQGKYFHRRQIASYPHKKSRHIINAERIYDLQTIHSSQKLSHKTGCSIKALHSIVRKGKGAYFSSGSRPNQTDHSWAIARLASAITGGRASVVDFSILDKGCNHKTSKAYKMALKAKMTKGR